MDSDLDIAAPVLSSAARAEVKTYVNALRTADKALGRLVAHFERSSEKTVIVALGDHRPALSAEVYAISNLLRGSDFDSLEKRYRCPVIIWSNFPLPREPIHTSDNFLVGTLLRDLGFEPSGFFAANAGVGSHIPVFESYIESADGRRFTPDAMDGSVRDVVEDYRLLQYDLLFGKQYLLLPSPGS